MGGGQRLAGRGVLTLCGLLSLYCTTPPTEPVPPESSEDAAPLDAENDAPLDAENDIALAIDALDVGPPVENDVVIAPDVPEVADTEDVAPAEDAGPPPEVLDPAAVALRFAPVWYQDTANNGPDGLGAKMDVPTAVDYDGDLIHNNNWDNLGAHDVEPTIYYALVATATHYFLTYSHYHARDWEQLCLGLTGLCHEGDMESAGVVVRRDPSGVGTVELVWTHAHGADSYWSSAPWSSAPPAAAKVVITSFVDFEDDAGSVSTAADASHTHVRLFSEAHGHGLVPCLAQQSALKPLGILTVQCPDDSGQTFPGGDGVKLVPALEATAWAPGMETSNQPVNYRLVDVEDTLWAWRDLIGPGQMFRPEEAFLYAGARGGPFATTQPLPEQFDPKQFLNDSISGKPPWVGTLVGSAASDRFFDPAWALSKALPVEDWSLTYTYHPYLPDAVGQEVVAPPELIDASALTVRFLGVGGVSFRHGGDHALSAPLFTNPSVIEVLGDITPNTAMIDAFLEPAFVADVSAILVGHGHYDHLMDVPHVWTHTAGARIYGNMTTKHMLAALGPTLPPGCGPEPPAGWPSMALDTVVALNDPNDDRVDSRLCAGSARCDGTWAGSKGQWTAVPNSNMRIRGLCSMHPAQFLTIHFGQGCLDAPLCAPPSKADAWVEGATLAFLLDFLDPETGKPTFRVYYQDAPTDAPFGHVHAELLGEKRIDLAVLNVGSYGKVADQPTASIAALNPRYVLAAHWEDFFVSQAQPLAVIPFLDLVEYDKRMAAALPPDGGPQLLINGQPELSRGWIPSPGDQLVIAPE